MVMPPKPKPFEQRIMPSIEVNGVTLTFSLGYPFSGGLSGRDLVVHSTGSQAVTGTFYFSTLIEFGAADMYPLPGSDFRGCW